MSEYTFFKGIKEGQKHFGESIGTTVNSILLSLVYIIGIGSTSLIAKIFGKNFLELKINQSKKTYWEDLNLRRSPIESYYRQF